MREKIVSTPSNAKSPFDEVTVSPQQLQSISYSEPSFSNLSNDHEAQRELNVGDAVRISGQESGVIRYLGNVHFQVNIDYW